MRSCIKMRLLSPSCWDESTVYCSSSCQVSSPSMSLRWIATDSRFVFCAHCIKEVDLAGGGEKLSHWNVTPTCSITSRPAGADSLVFLKNSGKKNPPLALLPQWSSYKPFINPVSSLWPRLLHYSIHTWCLRVWALLQLHDLVPTRLLLVQKLPAPLFKAYKRDATGPAACVCSLVLFSLLLNDSCLNDTKANVFLLCFFCLYSSVSLTLISKWGQLIQISSFLPKLMRRLRDSQLPSGKQKRMFLSNGNAAAAVRLLILGLTRWDCMIVFGAFLPEREH